MMTETAPTLWTETEVQRLLRTAYVFDQGQSVVLDSKCAPADGLEAARRILGASAEFSHLAGRKMPVYTTKPVTHRW